MADQPRVAPLRGDEAELFRSFNAEFMRLIRRCVPDSGHEVVEDACAFAWSRFLVCQPDRDRNWRGWLYRTAQHKAWELARERKDTFFKDEPGRDSAADILEREPDPRDAYRARLALRRALDAFERLTDEQKRFVSLRAQGYTYDEMQELTGETYAYVNRRLVEANTQLRLLLTDPHDRPPKARVQRLHDLERDPPGWLTDRIGPPPRSDTHRPAGTALQAWRRAALAIDDYRREHEPSLGFGQPRPGNDAAKRAWTLAQAAVRRLEAARQPQRAIERER